MRGDYDQQTTYGADPAGQAAQFADAGARWLHVVDLDGARDGTMHHLEQIGAICAADRQKVEVGGGIRSADTVDRLLGLGVERVVLGTAALNDWNWFESLASRPEYDRRLVLGLDARKGRLAVSGWEQQLDATAEQIADRVRGWPLAAIVYTDIATDGTMQGPNLEAVERMTAATDVPIVASGGIGNLEHLRSLAGLPVAGVIVGRAIYERAFTVEDAIAVFEANPPP